MTTLDDLREAGYDVALAWEGYRDPVSRVVSPGVYAVSREGIQLDPTKPDFDGWLRVYVRDTSDDLDDLLESVRPGKDLYTPDTPERSEVDPREPPGLPAEVRSENESGDE